MDNKDSFENLLKAKMDAFEQIPSDKLNIRLKQRLTLKKENAFSWKKVVSWVIASLLILSFLIFKYIGNTTSSKPIPLPDKIQQAHQLDNKNFHDGLTFNHHAQIDESQNLNSSPAETIADSSKKKHKVLVIKTPDDIKNKPYLQARRQAKSDQKLIFIHAFNMDCSHCQKMKTITLADKEVQDFLQDHFVKIDIDMQLKENFEVIRFYDIQTSPTFMFLNGEGQIINISKGFQEPEKFIRYLEKAMEEAAAGSYIDLMSRKRVNPTPDKLQKTHPLKNILLPDSILLAATSANKSILINVFETDCAKCEKLEKFTIQDKAVQPIINTHFYRWIIDAAQAQDIGLFHDSNKKVLPSTFIYNNKGTWITKFAGFMPPKPFIKTLNQSITQNALRYNGLHPLEAKVYPNPTTGKFTTSIKGQESPLQINIIDLNGKIILEKKLPAFHGEEAVTFDLTGIQGPYIVQFSQGKSMIYKKIIVQ